MIKDMQAISPHSWFYDTGDQLKNHIYARSREAFARGDAARDALKNPEDVRARQRMIRETFLACLGGLPPMDTPLDPVTTGTLAFDGFRVEKVIFQSRPKTYVTGNLYVPDGRETPGPAVLFLCGHHRQAKHVEEYQIVCRSLTLAGLTVFAVDPVGQGERFSFYDPGLGAETVPWGTYEHDYVGVQCEAVGDSIARYFLHDAMRALDYLATRPEVDPSRIGVTGNSGGGTQTSLMMLADTRVAAAAPATFIMSRDSYQRVGGAQDAEQVWPGFSLAGLDHEDIVLAMAPRPVLILSVDDDFFPIEGTRRTAERSKRIYELLGFPGNIDAFSDQSTHAYTRKMACRCAAFFARHLAGNTLSEEVKTAILSSVQPIAPELLWCTKTGQVLGDYPDAVFPWRSSRERAQEKRAPETSRDPAAIAWLTERVHAFRKPRELTPRFAAPSVHRDWFVRPVCWWAQEDVMNCGLLIAELSRRDDRLPLTIAVWEGGSTRLADHAAWITDTLRSGRAVLVVNVSGAGAIPPNPMLAGAKGDGFYGVLHKLSDDLIFLGDSLAALRTYDVTRAIDLAHSLKGLIDPAGIQVYAHGREGIYGVWASLVDARVTALTGSADISFERIAADRFYDEERIKTLLIPGILR